MGSVPLRDRSGTTTYPKSSVEMVAPCPSSRLGGEIVA